MVDRLKRNLRSSFRLIRKYLSDMNSAKQETGILFPINLQIVYLMRILYGMISLNWNLLLTSLMMLLSLVRVTDCLLYPIQQRKCR